MLDDFLAFMEDRESPAMYVTGVAGTGKTTSLNEYVEHCADLGLRVVVCAHTHKAVKVLMSKIEARATINICTLHSYLHKRPTINMLATKLHEVEGNTQMALPQWVDVMFVDEFSMVGERDYVDIQALQYATEEQAQVEMDRAKAEGRKPQFREGDIITKVVYIGDPNQLPPVKDLQVIYPTGPHWVKLTKVHRQAENNPLIDTLMQINGFINGDEARPLIEHEAFERGIDIVGKYNEYKTDNKVMLAYTNARVQQLNAQIQGRDLPMIGDRLFSPTNRNLYTLVNVDSKAFGILSPREELLELFSKYKTLETLHEMQDLRFFHVQDEDGVESVRAVVFGHATFLEKQEELAKEAVAINRKIEQQFQMDSKKWTDENWKHPLAKERKLAWKRFLSFKDYVMCMDFPHAMTVHKSQGSTYDYVFLDTEDMGKCADRDYTMYLRLMYVAVSRAALKVYTN